MEELIAKKYVKALSAGADLETLEAMYSVFSALADSFKDEKFVNIVKNPNVSTTAKEEILLDAVKKADSKELNNFVKLLVEHKRIEIIPAIAEVLRKEIADTAKRYEGVVYSDTEIASGVIEELSSGLSKKFGSTITLSFVKNDFNGIKVDVDDLGVEINFSKDRIDSQIIEHIVQAI